MHCTCRTLLSGVFGAPLTRATPAAPSTFLVPGLASFSTSTSSAARARKDGNPARGVSALRRTGLKRQKLSIKPSDLPKPVLDPERRSKVQVDEHHGLWEFFPADRKSMATPEEMSSHGRAWYIQELRRKDWDDLHRLWWTCLKDKNRLLTYKMERERVGNMYGEFESDGRERTIKRTMKRIKFVLTERWYTWENARVAAMQDEQINMYADLDAGEIAYLPERRASRSQSQARPEAADAAAQTTILPLELPKPELKV